MYKNTKIVSIGQFIGIICTQGTRDKNRSVHDKSKTNKFRATFVCFGTGDQEIYHQRQN